MVFNNDELVMYKENGKTYSGGFMVNSIMLQHGISPITRVSGGGDGGGGGISSTSNNAGTIHETFNNLAIPAGLYYFDTGLVGQSGGTASTYINEEYVGDEYYSKLMELLESIENSENNKTQGKHKKTKKHRFLGLLGKKKTLKVKSNT